ncbi:MAG: GTPase ObgE [Elusimicrobia bacterium]|nr:GTPase ObgE [Elusimicrobiota bacterium]
MEFIDKVRLFVTAGNGGNGCLSFHREKFIEFGGPDGGDGGRGGSVFLEASPQLTTLLELARKPHLRGCDGMPGKGKGKTGESAADTVVYVPAGSVLYRDGVLLADLAEPGQRFLAAEGGRGGRGNLSFRSRRVITPRLCERGAPGEKTELVIELKLLADVGLAGFPNAGKSSLLARISNARPKVADYPFTTLTPNLGVVAHKDNSFVAADIPGLIAGAHQGKGLGISFLRHIERTRVLVHLVDPAGFGGRAPQPGIKDIEAELKAFSPKLAAKPRIIAVNKIDLPGGREVLRAIKARYPRRTFGISAATGEGVGPLLDRVIQELSRLPPGPVRFPGASAEGRALRMDTGFRIRPLGGGRFVLEGRFVNRAAAMLDPSLPEAVERFQTALKRIGVDRALKHAGIQDGDLVRCGDYEFEWTDAPRRPLPRLKGDRRTRIGVGKK